MISPMRHVLATALLILAVWLSPRASTIGTSVGTAAPAIPGIGMIGVGQVLSVDSSLVPSKEEANTWTQANIFRGSLIAQGPLAVVDFNGAVTMPIQAGPSTAIPATCSANRQFYVKMDATPGRQLFLCNSVGNGWNLIGDGN